MQTIVDQLRSLPFIDDIVIWNNDPDEALHVEGDDIFIINSPVNYKTYGRFLCTYHARHPIIYTQDDDLLNKNIPELYRQFVRDPERIAHGLSERHYKNRDRFRHESAQVAYVGFGGLFNREWLSVFDTYIDCYGIDDLFLREADRIFSLLLHREHNVLPVEADLLPGTSGAQAMWVDPNHWQYADTAEKRALKLLGLPVSSAANRPNISTPNTTDKFVIFGSARSGSGLLVDTLNSHPAIRCHHELFLRTSVAIQVDNNAPLSDLENFFADADSDPESFLQRVWQYRAGEKAVGFKFFNDNSPEARQMLLHDRQIAKIVLRRRNLLRQYVSKLLAIQTKQWVLFDDADKQNASVHLNLDEFYKYCESIHSYYACLYKELYDSGQRYHELWYENLAGDQARTLRSVIDFLGVSTDVPLSTVYKKQNDKPLSTLISNYDEVAATLLQSDYASFLDEEQSFLGSLPDRRCEKFVILFTGRSGSGLLCDLLDSHPDIKCYTELFMSPLLPAQVDEWSLDQIENYFADRDDNPAKFLSSVWQRNAGKSIVGFKLKKDQHPDAETLLLKDRTVTKVVLRRKNFLRQYVSYLIGRQTKQYVLHTGHSKRSAKVRFDPTEFTKYCEENDRYFSSVVDTLERTGQEFIELYYEDFENASDRQDALTPLMNALGVTSSASLKTSFIKQNPEPLDQIVENYDEVYDALKDSDYAPFLEGEPDSIRDTVCCHLDSGVMGES